MQYNLFSRLYKEASQYNDIDVYVAERGWQEWMEEYSTEDKNENIETDNIVKILYKVYELYNSSIREMRESIGLSRDRFSSIYNIPGRTLQDWEYSKNKMPEYTKCLIAYTIFQEELFDDQEQD